MATRDRRQPDPLHAAHGRRTSGPANVASSSNPGVAPIGTPSLETAALQAATVYMAGQEIVLEGAELGVLVDGPFIDLLVSVPGQPGKLCVTLERDDARRLFGRAVAGDRALAPVHEHGWLPQDPLADLGAYRDYIVAEFNRNADGSPADCDECEVRARATIYSVADRADRSRLLEAWGDPKAWRHLIAA